MIVFSKFLKPRVYLCPVCKLNSLSMEGTGVCRSLDGPLQVHVARISECLENSLVVLVLGRSLALMRVCLAPQVWCNVCQHLSKAKYMR